jgi:hypothetical protein
MQYYKVLVSQDYGKKFYARVVDISVRNMVLRGEQSLPVGVLCDMQVCIPSVNEKISSYNVGIKAEVRQVIFTEGFIHLDCSIKSLSSEARQILGA